MTIVTRLDYASPVPGDERVLLVMLPGAGIRAAEFAAQGMVEALHAHGLPVDVAVVEPDLALYLEDGVAAALHRHVIEPARAQGYQRIWLLGISLGGMGALLYASAHPAHVEGLVLLAPFLGTRGTMAALAKAGGLGPETQSLATTAPEQRLLGWLTAHLARGASAPALYLGYARQDRFAPGHRLLAAHLPPARTAIHDGGHDWPAWSALWRELLTRAPFRPPASGDSDCYKNKWV
jgi:pimeloyl-ACP methyl ester carboxylesterase